MLAAAFSYDVFSAATLAALVFVGLGRVDMTVAGFDGGFHCGWSLFVWGEPGAVSKLGDSYAIGEGVGFGGDHAQI